MIVVSDSDGSKNLLIALAIIIVVFGLLFSINLFFKQKPQTVEDLVAKTLGGDQNIKTNYVYNGFVFVKIGPLWQTIWQSDNTQYTILLHFSPLELENISIVGELDPGFNQREIYLTFDPLGSDLKYVALSAGELSLNLVRALNISTIAACSRNETNACSNRPIVNCSNSDKPVIFLKEDPVTKIDLKGKCVVLQGSGVDIVKVTDRLVYQWYSIMD